MWLLALGVGSNKSLPLLYRRFAEDKPQEDERSQLFAALFPQIGELAVLAFDLVATLPFQSGYSRRAFRSQRVEHHQEVQTVFLQTLLNSKVGKKI